MPDQPDKPRPEDDEPETYDLAEDPADQQPAPPPPPRRPSGESSASSTDTIEPPAPDTPRPPADRSPGSSDAGYNPSGEEPAAVSPAKAQATREEQRIRAAAELAEADARKRKIMLIAVGSIVGLCVVVYLVLKIL